MTRLILVSEWIPAPASLVVGVPTANRTAHGFEGL